MTGDTSGSDTNIDSVNAKAMYSVHESTRWPFTLLTLMWKWILIPIWLRNELRNCYDKYSNNLDDTDTRFINVAYMKIHKHLRSFD